MIYIWPTIILMLICLNYLMIKDLKNPAIVSGVIWFGLYLILIFTQDRKELSDSFYGIFALAYVCFSVGFFMTKPKKKHRINELSYIINWNPDCKRMLFFVCYLASLIWFVLILKYIFNYPGGVWAAARFAVGESSILQAGYMGVLQSLVTVFFLVTYTYYLLNSTKRNRRDFIICCPPMGMVLLLSPRGIWFFVIISMVYLYFIIKNVSNRKTIKLGIIGLLSFVIIFLVSSIQKYATAYTSYSLSEKLIMLLKSYFSLPPVAFVQWLHSSPTYSHGAYLFRFFYAVLAKIGLDVPVVNTVQEFIYIGDTSTNVYTALHWYANDFGIISVIVIEFFLGILYGWMYKKVRNSMEPKVFYVLLLSFLMFPIINQFFDEKIFSILSIWLQRIFFLYIFTCTRLTIKKRNKN